jgi:hypothetical protein
VGVFLFVIVISLEEGLVCTLACLKGTPENRTHFIITHNVSSMQNKQEKSSNIQMVYNFKIECRKL